MPKPSSNLFRCEPERLDLPLLPNSELALLSPKTQFLQGGLVGGFPTILIVLEDPNGPTLQARIWAHELRSSLDILEPVTKKRERKPKKARSAAEDILSRTVSSDGEHRG